MDAVTDVPTPQPFAYLGTPNAQLYSAALGVSSLAKQRFTVHLRHEDDLADWPRNSDPIVPPADVPRSTARTP